MIDLNTIISKIYVFLIDEPILISTFVALFVGIIYFFGWIVNANNWQYQNSDRQGHMYKGLFFIVTFLIFPIFVIFGIVYLLEIFGLGVTFFMSKIPLWIYLLIIIVLLFALEKLDDWIKKKLSNFEDVMYHLGVGFSKVGDIKYLFYLSNYGIFVSSEVTPTLILITLVLDIMILIKWARLSTLNQQGAEAIITLNKGENLRVRLIEFVEKGGFLKIQDKKSKKVYAIPTLRIEKIELISKQFLLKTFVESKMEKLIGIDNKFLARTNKPIKEKKDKNVEK